MAPKFVLKGLQMLFTAAPSIKYSPVKLMVRTHCHRLFALSCFSNSGDGPHWVITLLPSPLRTRKSRLLGNHQVSSTGAVAVEWGRGSLPLGPMAVFGWGVCKESLGSRVVGWSLIRSTYSTQPSHVPRALDCPHLHPVSAQAGEVYLDGGGRWGKGSSGWTCALLLGNQIWKSLPFPHHILTIASLYVKE